MRLQSLSLDYIQVLLSRIGTSRSRMALVHICTSCIRPQVRRYFTSSEFARYSKLSHIPYWFILSSALISFAATSSEP
jgi:hypothetical protein